jgi:NitT/TauT family transport system permease protein
MTKKIDIQLMNPYLISILSILLIIFFPASNKENIGGVLGIFVVILLVYSLFLFYYRNHRNKKSVTADLTALVLFLILLWELLTNKFGILSSFLYPSPGEVLHQFQEDANAIGTNLLSSVQLLGSGVLLAIIVGVPLGMVGAWYKRLERIFRPIASVMSPIPPIVWIPYAIAILPSFQASSTFIIFIGAFWPIFINTLNGVVSIDRRYINSARTLGVKDWSMFRKIILPAALPSIFTGITVGLILSFILLTAAEMIGSSAGIGWYVKNATDFGNYNQVVTGILFIGFVVTVIMTLMHQLERHLLRWRKH